MQQRPRQKDLCISFKYLSLGIFFSPDEAEDSAPERPSPLACYTDCMAVATIRCSKGHAEGAPRVFSRRSSCKMQSSATYLTLCTLLQGVEHLGSKTLQAQTLDSAVLAKSPALILWLSSETGVCQVCFIFESSSCRVFGASINCDLQPCRSHSSPRHVAL